MPSFRLVLMRFSAPSFPRRIAAAACCLLLAACSTTSGMRATAPLAGLSPQQSRLAILAVEGPAPELGSRFGSILAQEAESRGFILAQGAEPATRVKAYLEPFAVQNGALAFSYVLQTSPDGQTRANRVSGFAEVSAPASSAWAALDESTMRAIAGRSLDDLARQLTLNADIAANAPEEAQ